MMLVEQGHWYCFKAGVLLCLGVEFRWCFTLSNYQYNVLSMVGELNVIMEYWGNDSEGNN
jgi:hypothetical protein